MRLSGPQDVILLIPKQQPDKHGHGSENALFLDQLLEEWADFGQGVPLVGSCPARWKRRAGCYVALRFAGPVEVDAPGDEEGDAVALEEQGRSTEMGE